MTDSQPLSGLKVLVTRAAGRGEGLATRLRELGAEPLLHPTIAYAPPEEAEALATALDRLEAGLYEWLLLTSITAVEAVANGLTGRALGGRVSLKIGAVGPATAEACERLLGASATAVPERFTGAELALALGDPAGRRVLLPNADIARPALEQRLREAGALVERVVAYRTVPAPGGAELAATLGDGAGWVILLSSPSTAQFLLAQLGSNSAASLKRALIACIGPTTADACRELGLEPDVVAEQYSEDGLVEALVAYIVSSKRA
jgi:uroporphyrinogen-III synthase